MLFVAVAALSGVGCGGGCNDRALSGSGGFPAFGGRGGASSPGAAGSGGSGAVSGRSGGGGMIATGAGAVSGGGGSSEGGNGGAGCMNLDPSRCDECLTSDASVLRCGVAPVTSPVWAAAIASNGSEVGLAFITHDAADAPVVRFARLAPDLAVLGTTEVARPLNPARDVGHVNVAAQPSGWLVSFYAERGLHMVAVDAAGVGIATTRIVQLGGEDLLDVPRLAARPNGGPFITWRTSAGGVAGALIAADGSSLTGLWVAERDQPIGALHDVAFVTGLGAFVVALTLETPSDVSQLRLVRISGNGVVDGATDALVGSDVSNVRLVRDAADVRVIYDALQPPEVTGGDVAWSTVWQRLDAAGNPTTPPFLLGKQPGFTGSARGAAFADDTLAVLDNPPAAIDIVQIASNGTLSRQPFRLTSGAQAQHVDVTRRGPDAVVMWTSAKGIRLARLAIAGAVP